MVEAALLTRRYRLLSRAMATPGAMPPWDLGLRMVVVAMKEETYGQAQDAEWAVTHSPLVCGLIVFWSKDG